MSKFSKMIEKRSWRHDRFLLILALILLIALLSFSVVLLGLVSSGRINSETMKQILLKVGIGLLFGLISGVFSGFALLIHPYRNEKWDLHEIVPTYLIKFLALFLFLLFLEYFTSIDPLYQASFNIGLGIGGFIPVIAYSAEVAKEHPEYL